MPLTAPVTITGNIAGAYAMKFKVQGVEGDVSILELLQFLTESAASGSGDSIYIDFDWIIKGSPGIEAGVSLPGTHLITVPEGKSLSSLQTRIVDPETELDEDGNMRVNIAWNTSDYNQGLITAFSPFVFFLDSDGNQFTAAELGIPVTNSAASGLTSTEIGINNILPTPFTIKLIF
ncbi:hypothetical protein [Haliscomenobacter sp.]|uniref:hypothetical protein n=1 Tax=Haliscomenobacter sp. TaxID=2717303 RepID=UPI003BAD86F5